MCERKEVRAAMPEIRLHGRGGQGAALASRLLAEAAFIEGRHAQSFPAFGLERRGAPVTAYTRIQDTPILNHSKIYAPDAAVVLDATLLKLANVAEGLKPGGLVVINTDRRAEELGLPAGLRVATVNAGAIAAERGLGSRLAPIVNTAILGAFAAASGVVSLESVMEAIRRNVAFRTEDNAAACELAALEMETALL